MIRSTPERSPQTVTFEIANTGKYVFHFYQGKVVAVQFLPNIDSHRETSTMYSDRGYENNDLISRWVHRLSKKHMSNRDYSFVSYGKMSEEKFKMEIAHILNLYSGQFLPYKKSL